MNPMTDGSPDYALLSKIVGLTRLTMTRPPNLLSPCTPPQRSCKPPYSKGHGSQQSHCSSKINRNGKMVSQVHEEQHTASIDTQTHTRYHVKATTPHPHPKNHHTSNMSNTSHKQRTIEICQYCGGWVPHNSKCKARDQICNYCKKMGNFAWVCERKAKDKKTAATDKVDIQHLESFVNISITLDKVDATPSSSKSLHHPYPSISLQIYFNGQHTTTKMDSGAEANIVSKQTFNILQPQPTLSESKVKLKPYGSPPLPVLIQFSATLVANGHTIEH